jgi:ABC-type transporter Mla MlaB component
MTMAGKRKTVRKGGGAKKVIDYDPLAWLDEADASGGNEPEAGQEPAGEPAAEADSEPVTATGNAVGEDAGYGFFEDRAENDDAPTAPPVGDDEGSSAYGFFDETPDTGASGETDSADDDGYGFFEDAPAADTPGQDEDDGAYGFFDDDSPSAGGLEPWKDEDSVIHLGAELGIRNVQKLHGLIAESLAQGFDPRIDAGELQKIDSAGLQMIYSLRMTLEKTGQSIVWSPGSGLIDQRASELGLPALAGEAGGAADDDNGYGFF